MDNIIFNGRPLQLCLKLTLLFSFCAAWPSPQTESDNFVFPSDNLANQANLVGTRSSNDRPESCSWPEIWYQQSRKCEELLTPGPCGNNQWLTLGRGGPQCQARPCQGDQITYKGECVLLSDNTHCPPGMEIVMTVTGVGACDCKRGFVYWTNTSHPQQESCYPAYEQGPCPDRQILYIPDEKNAKAKCTPSRCKKGEVDIVVRNGTLHLAQVGRPRGTCRVLRDQGPCERGKIVDIDTNTMKLECALLQVRTLINAPVLNCSPGSKRDALGRCRRSMF